MFNPIRFLPKHPAQQPDAPEGPGIHGVHRQRSAPGKKKAPAPPCGIIYLNLVTKGVPYTPH
jgi:hypothetical protein